jgi:hypothetical protein
LAKPKIVNLSETEKPSLSMTPPTQNSVVTESKNDKIQNISETEKPSLSTTSQNKVVTEPKTVIPSETEKPSISTTSPTQTSVDDNKNRIPIFKPPPVDDNSSDEKGNDFQPQVEYNPTVVSDGKEILKDEKNLNNVSSKSRKRRNKTVTLVNQNFDDPRINPAIAAAKTKSNEVRAMTSNYLSCINVEGPLAGLALIDTGAENANLITKKYLADLEKTGVKIEILPDSTKVFSLNKDPYPLPRIDDTIDHLSNQKIFSVVDAQKGFWQIPVFEEHQERLAFITPFGKYQFKVLPFGFTLAPGIFQKAMNETLDGLLFLNCLVYIDDIIIYSENYEQHLKDLEQVFARLQAFNWKLKLEKCKFAQTKIQYLGHIVSHNKIEMLPKNLEKIQNLSPPKNVKELQRFLGMINYYRRFIQGLAYLTEPLLINLRQSKWTWEKDQQEAYAKILRKFTEEPILKLPDFDRPFIVKTDASDYGYGAVLAQEVDGVEHPIAFSSGSFCPAQRNYSAWEREALSVILAVKKYEHYLKDKEFKIVTDNQINSYLLSPEKLLVNQRTVRWQVYLKSFKYTIEHRPGKYLVLV